MESYGYVGKILRVDLTTRKTEIEDLALEELGRSFVGDIGISMRLAYDLLKKGIDPLSSDNVIIFGAGPLVGTKLTSCTRCGVVTKFPLTGAIVAANTGMKFSRKLKSAGYDHLVVTGRAEKPVYLKIMDEEVEVCSADDLWGKDIVETTAALWSRHGKTPSVIAIGQAGENQVKLALALVDGIAHAGKGGLAAVMGSKNLKAIIIDGSKRVRVADSKRFKEAIDRMPKSYLVDPTKKDYMDKPQLLRDFGKVYFLESWIKQMQGVPYKNWTEIYPWQEFVKTYALEEYLQVVKRESVGCPGCPHPCKERLEIISGEYKGLKFQCSSIIGRSWDLGIRCGVGPWDKTIKVFDVMNRYGIEIHVFVGTMMLAVDLYEKGIITKEDTGGFELRSDFETAMRLVEQVAFKQGIGTIMGDGEAGLIKEFGGECEKHSTHVKGVSTQHDPRSRHFTVDSFTEITNPKGASVGPAFHSGAFRVEKGFSKEPVRTFCERLGISKEATERILDVPFGYNVARLSPYAENHKALLTALGICDHDAALYTYDHLAELYSAATGIEVTSNEAMEAADRIWNMLKVLNVREGFSRKDDRIPPKYVQPLKTVDGGDYPPIGCEGREVSLVDLERLLDDYYEERGWDVRKGIPPREKLAGLGLIDIAQDLERQGIFSVL